LDLWVGDWKPGVALDKSRLCLPKLNDMGELGLESSIDARPSLVRGTGGLDGSFGTGDDNPSPTELASANISSSSVLDGRRLLDLSSWDADIGVDGCLGAARASADLDCVSTSFGLE
jgi:hypothetical protein